MTLEDEFIRLLSTDNKKIALRVKSEIIFDIGGSTLLSEEEKEKTLDLLKKLELVPNRFVVLKDLETQEVKSMIINEKENNDVIILEVNFENGEIKYEVCKTKEVNISYEKNLTSEAIQLNLEMSYNTLFISMMHNKVEKIRFLKEINYLLKDGKLVKDQPSILTSMIIKDDETIIPENFFTKEIIDMEKLKIMMEIEEKRREKFIEKFMSEGDNIIAENDEDKKIIKN